MRTELLTVIIGCALAVTALPAFTEDTIRVDDLHAPMFTTVDIPVYLENTDTSVQMFSLRLTTDTAVLDYTGYSRGTLTEDFQMLGVGEVLPGVMIVQGFDDTMAIPAGSNGSLAILHFDVMTGVCDLLLSHFSDDITGFTADNGSFLACQPEWLWLVRSLPDTC
ncbi:MAG TPA: hypothetical protein PLV45_10855, partial [bacterium]|nr:hypothetical protein [bacterium]